MNDFVIYRHNNGAIEFYYLGKWVAINKKKSWFNYLKASQLIAREGMTGKWHTMSAADYDEIVVDLLNK
jgi:hypothetical protein